MESSPRPTQYGIPSSTKASRVSLSEIVSALSFALDLVEDAKPGHAVRCCLLGLRIARRMGLSEAEQTDLYYALLLKDSGCSSNARLITSWVGGDDRTVKRDAKLLDWTQRSVASIRLMWRNAPAGSSVLSRIRRLYRMAQIPEGISAELIRARCERGADVAYRMGMSDVTAEAIRSLDEHWDGCGYPDCLRGDHIPLLSRIMLIVQHLDIFASEFGTAVALYTLKERSGRWFDPDIVRLVSEMDHEVPEEGTRPALWQDLWSGNEHEIVRQNEPGLALQADDDRVDRIAEAFAIVVDAKSTFTYAHSVSVSGIAVAIARQMHLEPERIRILYRAALLHDLGKLRVPNTILDKTGPLSESDWNIIREHPGLSRQILERIGAFAEVACIAGAHHEKLDGSGYPEGLTASQLPLEARILTVADMYSALTEVRPYREHRPVAEALVILDGLAPREIDPACLAALKRHLHHEPAR